MRLQESESHTEEIINRLRTVPLFHRHTSEPGGVKTDLGIRSTSNGDTFGGSRLLVKSMFRRTPRQGKCTCTPASVHLSNTTAKRKGIARSLLGEVREVADMNCVDIVGGGFNVAAFCEPRKLGRIHVAWSLHMPPDGGPMWEWMADSADCCGLIRTTENEKKTWKLYQHGNIQAAHLLVYTH